ncbi:MAG TPA: hypothetical protein DDW53_19445 [Lachnoclostridium sp.]|nr:hypothetical protein [Lachnoclostridium sp.]
MQGAGSFEMLKSVSEGFALFLYFCILKAYEKGSCRNKGLFAKEMGCILTDIYYNKLESPICFMAIGLPVF